MERIVVGFVMIGVGALLIKYKDDFVTDITKTNNVGFGIRKYGKKEVESGQRSIVVFGILAIVLGILRWVGIF